MVMLELKRRDIPLDRDVIFLAESGEEGNVQYGIEFMVNEHLDVIEAEYYLAESADELLHVFSTIPVQIRENKERMEVSAVFTAIGALLALAAVALGLRWNPLP